MYGVFGFYITIVIFVPLKLQNSLLLLNLSLNNTQVKV